MLLPQAIRSNILAFSHALYYEISNWRMFEVGSIWSLLTQRQRKSSWNKSIRKLSLVFDPDGKTRIIAILDY